jgi:hypothetical protein
LKEEEMAAAVRTADQIEDAEKVGHLFKIVKQVNMIIGCEVQRKKKGQLGLESLKESCRFVCQDLEPECFTEYSVKEASIVIRAGKAGTELNTMQLLGRIGDVLISC